MLRAAGKGLQGCEVLFPAKFSHSVAADSVLNHVFVPVSNTGALVFTDDHDFGGGPNQESELAYREPPPAISLR